MPGIVVCKVLYQNLVLEYVFAVTAAVTAIAAAMLCQYPVTIRLLLLWTATVTDLTKRYVMVHQLYIFSCILLSDRDVRHY